MESRYMMEGEGHHSWTRWICTQARENSVLRGRFRDEIWMAFNGIR